MMTCPLLEMLLLPCRAQVFAIPYFRLVPSAWTYITVDTPYVLSRDFVM
jgi:hypothetical protein